MSRMPDGIGPGEPMEQRLTKAMAELDAVRTAAAAAEEQLRNASLTVRSRDRAVEVSVGASGELLDLRFLDGKYRTMTAAQLAASVLEAARQGRTEMAHRVIETFEPLTRPSGDTPEFGGIDIDWERIFGSALGGGPGARGARSAGDRLRDEIHEDTPDAPRPTRGRDQT
ncbi:YbaB/EbfC family nucleoid-associated protein [Streptomyces zagrosensis]|uniref:DNA-binding protein YbaB n=1 Tax=Streptomyces zagrosensis TaxID=1042984 RepID=A0A7W9QG88_9ACTN|nr:YbaB/EbfC family nucleoid-associated protein [Streptomyces zagrosensis]MBB5939700.1 DNA-binding protein YbaB [Streptomyces zagrosensis]